MMSARLQKPKLNARLTELERFYSAAANALSAKERSDEAIAAVRAILAELGVEQQSHESLMEAFARALGISSRELRDELWGRAQGARLPAHG